MRERVRDDSGEDVCPLPGACDAGARLSIYPEVLNPTLTQPPKAGDKAGEVRGPGHITLAECVIRGDTLCPEDEQRHSRPHVEAGRVTQAQQPHWQGPAD